MEVTGYGNERYFEIIIHLKDGLDIEFTACYGGVMPEEALTSFSLSDAYSLSLVCGSGIVIEVRK